MSRKILTAALCSIVVASPASAMTAAEFLTKANKLQKMGPAALMSSDMKLLRQEGETAGNYYRDMLKKQRKNGGTLHSCPPKKGSMNSGELISHLRAMPAAQRQNTSFRSAFLMLMKKKYPC